MASRPRDTQPSPRQFWQSTPSPCLCPAHGETDSCQRQYGVATMLEIVLVCMHEQALGMQVCEVWSPFSKAVLSE